jgi:hypothetical protein
MIYKGVQHKLLPDVESTIASFGFFVESGISAGREPKEFLPRWLRKKVADFAYSLQDEDGYFYHPQWGKDIYDLRKTRDYGTSIRLLRLDDREPRYPLPTVQAASEDNKPDLSKIPERFRSVENFKKYLDEEIDFKNKAYASGSVLSSGLGELLNYGKMLGADLVEMVIERLNRDQRPESGFWSDSVDYNGTNGRIRPRMTTTPRRQLKRALHKNRILASPLHDGGGFHSADVVLFAARDFAYLSRMPFTSLPLWVSEKNFARSTASLMTIGAGISVALAISHAPSLRTLRSTVPSRYRSQ